jgi:phage terminase large subunit-like protein
MDNLRPACRRCNSQTGATYKAKRDALRIQERNNAVNHFLDTKQTPPTPCFSNILGETGDNQPQLAGIEKHLPRLETVGLNQHSYGARVSEWATNHMGIELMTWQTHSLTGQLCHDGKGNLQFREALVSTARQQGKSVALQALIGWWITELAALRGKPQFVLSVANKLDRAEAIFGFIAPILVDKFGGKAANALGRKSVKMPDGSTWEVRAATPNLHGGSYDLIVIDELWNISAAVVDEALRPSQIARTNPLLSMWSTAGDESSAAMIQFREQAISEIDTGTTGSLYFGEYSMKPGSDPRLETNWIMANPAMGQTVTIEALRAVSKKDSFLRAHLNMWVSARGAWLQPGVWDKQKTDVAMPPGGVLAVDTDLTDGRYVGVRSTVFESKAHVCVEFMVDTEDDMWAEIERVMADTTVNLVITPALHLHLPKSLERRSAVIGYGELVKYSGLIQKMIVEGKVRHRGELSLAEHVNRAVLTKVGGGNVVLSSQKSPGPIELCRCMVWAIAESSRPKTMGKPMFVVATTP